MDFFLKLIYIVMKLFNIKTLPKINRIIIQTFVIINITLNNYNTFKYITIILTWSHYYYKTIEFISNYFIWKVLYQLEY